MRSTPCPCHQQQPRDRKCISARELRLCPEGSQKRPRIHALKTPPRANLLNRKEARWALRGLTTGFVGRFCGRFFGPPGGFGRVVSRRILADFCDLQNPPQKTTEKSTTSMAAFCEIVESRLKPKQAVSQFQAQRWYQPLKSESGLAASFSSLPCLRNSQSMATAPQETQRTTGFKPHKLIGKEITHSTVRRRQK